MGSVRQRAGLFLFAGSRSKRWVEHGRGDPTRPLRGHPPLKGEGAAPALQPPPHALQPVVPDAQRLQMLDGRAHIADIVAALAHRPAHDRGRMRFVHRAGILLMAAVGDIGHRAHLPAVGQAQADLPFQIDLRHQLPLAQIGHHLVAQFGRHAKRQTDAGAAAIEPQHQPRFFLRAAMHPGMDAQRAAIARQPRAAGLDMGKTRIPDQRAVAKHPKIAHIAKPDPPRFRTALPSGK